MKFIWQYIHNKKWQEERKTRMFLFLTIAFSSIAGLAVWYTLHFFALNKISWAICFAGYPGFFVGLIGGILYLYHHAI